MFDYKSKIKVHFIGIGGIGMSGIAKVLLQLGYKVSGSDQKESYTTQGLKNLGAEIYLGHREENINCSTVVVYSSAVGLENPEMVAAHKKGVPTIRRAEMLSELMRLKFGLAIAGTHGKTTTTSFLATILYECQFDPTLIIGGVVENLGGHARLGQGEVLVAEADESDGSFLLLGPIMSVITNIDDDHLDFYKTRDNLIRAFADFANKVPFYGLVALNIHDENLREVKKHLKRPWVSFGIHGDSSVTGEEIDYEAREIIYHGQETTYQLFYRGEFATEIKLNIPGRHNVLNSLGAMAIAHKMDLDFSRIALAIQKFYGVGRRFETLYKKGGFQVIDDYAHHPTEIRTTLSAVKHLGDQRVVVLFEPHRFSRTEHCWKDFLHCFNGADDLYIAPIYAASEKPIEGISGERLVQDINRLHPGLASYLNSMDQLSDLFNKYKDTNTIFMTLGAGSIGKKVREAVLELEE